jgi:hypothetical protein
MFLVVLVKPLFQNTKDVLLLKQKPALEVAEAAIYGKGVTAIFECG